MTLIKKIAEHIIELYHKMVNFIFKQGDPALLLFLLAVLNYRLSFKLLAIVGIYILRKRPAFKLDTISWFYILMMALGLFNFLFIHPQYTVPHFLSTVSGCIIWLACLLSYFQIRDLIEKNDIDKIINSLKALVIVNFVVSIFDLLKIIFITGALNPFTQVSPPPYGISSGDLIGGVYGSMHLVNTIISALLLVLFIYRDSLIYVMLCLIPFLLTGSNLGTFILVGILIMVAFLNRGILFKNLALFSITFISLFYITVTPSNQEYMKTVINKAFNQIQGKKKKENKVLAQVTPITDTIKQQQVNVVKEKKKPSKEELIISYIEYRKKQLGIENLNSTQTLDTSIMSAVKDFRERKKRLESKWNDYVFFRKDSVAKSKSNLAFFEYGKLKKFDLDNESGKITSFKQTYHYLSEGPKDALFGAGVGSFSSRLAFITSGIVEDSRLLMALPSFETPEFKNNHKAIFKYLMYRDDETHSITNLPFCWYNQVLGEYGLIGFFVFVLFYCGFWIKNYKSLGFGKYLFIAMLGFFFFDYWFERISVLVIFELLMLLDIKLHKSAKA